MHVGRENNIMGYAITFAKSIYTYIQRRSLLCDPFYPYIKCRQTVLIYYILDRGQTWKLAQPWCLYFII